MKVGFGKRGKERKRGKEEKREKRKGWRGVVEHIVTWAGMY